MAIVNSFPDVATTLMPVSSLEGTVLSVCSAEQHFAVLEWSSKDRIERALDDSVSAEIYGYDSDSDLESEWEEEPAPSAEEVLEDHGETNGSPSHALDNEIAEDKLKPIENKGKEKQTPDTTAGKPDIPSRSIHISDTAAKTRVSDI